MVKILVTGHLGYIGPMMVKVLRQAGHTVVGLDVGYFRECVTTNTEWPAPHEEISRDIRDVMLDDLVGCDAIIHLAGLSNDPLGELNPALTTKINYSATIKLAQLAKKTGVRRFVFASSCSMYGAAGNSPTPLDENSPLAPVSAYARAKAESEKTLSEMANKDFSPVFLRNATAYGVSPRMRFDLVLNNLMGWAQTTGTIKVMSDGTPWRPMVHIEDISRAALAAVEAPLECVHNEPFNIGRNDSNYTVLQIAEAVAACVENSKIEVTGESGPDIRSYRVDFSKANAELPGFHPQWDLTKGCEELKRWFSEGGLQGKDFQSRFFVRLKQLNFLRATGILDDQLRFRNV